MENQLPSFDKLTSTAKDTVSNQRGSFFTLIMAPNIGLTSLGSVCAFKGMNPGTYMCILGIVVIDIIALAMWFYLTCKKPGNFNGPNDFTNLKKTDKDAIQMYLELEKVMKEDKDKLRDLALLKRIVISYSVVLLAIALLEIVFVSFTLKDIGLTKDIGMISTTTVFDLFFVSVWIGIYFSYTCKRKSINTILNYNQNILLNVSKSLLKKEDRDNHLIQFINKNDDGDLQLGKKCLQEKFRIKEEQFVIDKKREQFECGSLVRNIILIDCSHLTKNISLN